jgi:hypothetical protein
MLKLSKRGHFVMSEEVHTEKEIVALEQSIPKKKKKVIIATIIILLVAAIAGGLYWKHEQTVQAEKAAAAAKKNTLETYKENMNLALAAATLVGSHAEKMGNQYHDVWYSAIFNHRYTTSDGQSHSYGTYSQAIKDQRDAYVKSSDTTKLKMEMATLESTVSKLKNPTVQYKEIYKELVDLYSTVTSFESLAEDPSGSLQSYTDDFNQLDTALAQKIKAIQVQLPK